MAKKPSKSSSKVGYKRPPKATRFKPGQSGNPKGRPKGSKNLLTMIRKEMRSRVPYKANGVDGSITLENAFIKRLTRMAAGGDYRAMAMVLKHLVDQEDDADIRDRKEEIFDRPEHRLVMESIIKRIRDQDAPDADPASDAPQPKSSDPDEGSSQ